jgi:N-acetylneuraminic acid mutarotase
MTAINGAIYTVGGYRFSNNITNGMHNSASFAKVQADGSLSSWTQVTSMDGCCTGQRGEGPLVNDGYGNMYYPGGISNYSAGSPLSGVYRETVRGNLWPSNGSWPHNSGISAMPAGRAGHRAEIANGYLYAIGGYAGASGSSVQSTVYYAKLNGSGGAGAWSTANAMPVSLKYHCSGVANGYMYVWGGDTGSGASNAIYYAKLNNDGSLGSWQTSSQTMPTGIASAGCAIINGRLYSFGGVTSAGSTTSAVYYAEIAKVRIYADLDLISLDSDSLAGSGNETGSSLMNGSNQKGSLFAGSIYAAGDLQATGSAQLTGGLTILDRFSTSGDALIKVNVNYSDRSVVVDNIAGSRVLTIDSFTSGETVGVNIGDTFGAIDAKMAVNGVTVGQNLMQVTDTSNGTLQALTIADGGATSFTNDCSTAAQCDETTAFQIQNASGTPLFNVDTLNARLTLGSTSANFDIDFEQNSSNRSAIVRDFVCTASEAAFDIVEFSAVDSAVRTTTANSNRVAGVVVAIPSLNTCTVAIGGVVQVNFGANPSPATIGDPVVTSATAGAAQSTTTPAVGAVLGNSISSKDGSNRVWVRLRRD